MSHKIGQLTFLRTLNIYIVGRKKGFGLTELGQLCLKGELHIKNLERLRSAMDAREANLMGKGLSELFLSWERKNSQSQLQLNVEKILEALEPHPKLVSIGLGGYQGSHFPHWMGNPIFKNLCDIRLMDCSYTLQLPQLGKLLSLKKLEMHNMPLVQYVDDESFDGGVVARGFPSLEYLLLSYMTNLERLSKEEGGDIFPSLCELTIVACPTLSLPSLPSVRKFSIAKSCDHVHLGLVSRRVLPQCPSTVGTNFNQGQLGYIHHHNCLEALIFIDDQELTSFPVGMLQDFACLKQLLIFMQSKLEVLPTELANTPALEDLYIVGCNNLESLTEQALSGLHSLQRLKIEECVNFKGLSTGFQYLTSLKDLFIAECPQVVSLSEDLQHIPMLQSISSYNLPNVASTPDCWGRIRSLQSLYIVGCPKLTCLPLGLGWLDSLRSLINARCPDLQKRFEREMGQDWHWLKHVPHVDLGTWGWSSPSWLHYEWHSINLQGI